MKFQFTLFRKRIPSVGSILLILVFVPMSCGKESVPPLVTLNSVEWDGQVVTYEATIVAGTEEAIGGLCWSATNEIPTMNDNVNSVDGSVNGDYGETLGGFNSSTTYYFRAFARTESGQEYSNVLQVSLGPGWKLVPGFSTKTFSCASSPSNHVFHVAGNYEEHYRTVDGGTTWIGYNHVGSSYIHTIFMVDDNIGYLTAANMIRKTTDGGVSWTDHASGPATSSSSIWFTDALTGYLVSVNDQNVFKTEDGGVNWVGYDSGIPAPQDLITLYFVSDSEGFVVTNSGRVCKTIDSGLTWSEVTTSPIPVLVEQVFFQTSTVGFVVGEQGIYRTVDGGVNWNAVYTHSDSNVELRAIDFADEFNGVCMGEDGLILMTDDGGINWKEVGTPIPGYSGILQVELKSSSFGYACGYGGVVLIYN